MHIRGIPRQRWTLPRSWNIGRALPRRLWAALSPSARNDLGAKGLDLPEQERRASGRFVRLRGPVLRRAALYDIADIDFLALETDCENHFIEQLSRAADKRASLLVFFGSRTLTDEDQAAFGRTFPEYQVSTARMKSAPGTPGQFIAYPRELLFPGLAISRRMDSIPGCLRLVCPVPETSGLITLENQPQLRQRLGKLTVRHVLNQLQHLQGAARLGPIFPRRPAPL